MATTVLCNCKKMMAIVKAKGLPYIDGKFQSGTNWEDCILWCLIKMSKECECAEVEKINSVVVVVFKSVEEEKLNGGGGGDVGLGNDAAVNDNQEEQDQRDNSDKADRYPDKTFFQCGVSFPAWALWGHIPIHNSSRMQSDLFGDVKKDASVGRKTHRRGELRTPHIFL